LQYKVSVDAEQTLRHISDIRRRARFRAHGGAWFPAAIIAALVLASVALYRGPFVDPFQARFSDDGDIILGRPESPWWAGLPAPHWGAVAAYAFWLVATPAAFGLIAWWYRRRARRVGVTVPWPTVLLVGFSAWAAMALLAAGPVRPVPGPSTVDWFQGLLSPLVPLALAVVTLGVIERAVTLVLAGGFIALVAWWFGAAGMGRLPGWLVYALDGFEGPARGGAVVLFIRPGVVLVVLALPLVVYAVVRGVRARR
jgi:hypothetical protein